jgi:putative glutamine amidotransferase
VKTLGKSARPLIGISMRLSPASGKFYLQTNYSEAVAAAGGIPVLIPLIPERSIIGTMADRLDGILLPGSGSDVDPKLYGSQKIRKCGEIHTARDKTDFLLLEKAFKRRLPLLAICFGIQSLNVFLGGTLIQDIPSQCQGALAHELQRSKATKTNPENFCTHRVNIEEVSQLYELAGKKTSAVVNSSHHQAIETIARNLKVTARATDGIIEGVELQSKDHFVFGTQWHPEKGFERDKLSQAIFKGFVQEAGKNQGR